MPSRVIEAHGLSKQFILRHNQGASLKVWLLGLLHERQREVKEPFWALQDVTLTIDRGDSVAIIGRNGSGKSTLLKLIAGIHRPTNGRLLVAAGARMGTLIELGVGFHPDLTGTENVFINAAIHGLTREEIEALYPRVVEYSGLGQFMDVPIKNYSSGMYLRLGFAVAANLDPDVLLLDEIFAVGDEDFQRKCVETMRRFTERGGTTIFVSHAPPAVRAICRRACLLDQGRLLFAGDVDVALAEYHRLLREAPAGRPSIVRPSAVESALPDRAGDRDSPGAAWTLDFLKRQGLQPHHRVVEMGLETGDVSTPLARHVGPDRYVYWQVLMQAPAGLESADYVIAPSVFSQFSLNVLTRFIAVTLLHAPPACRLFATFFDAPGLEAFLPLPRPKGVTSFPESEPYHYRFDVLSGIAAALGARADRIEDSTHPDGESVVVFTRS